MQFVVRSPKFVGSTRKTHPVLFTSFPGLKRPFCLVQEVSSIFMKTAYRNRWKLVLCLCCAYQFLPIYRFPFGSPVLSQNSKSWGQSTRNFAKVALTDEKIPRIVQGSVALDPSKFLETFCIFQALVWVDISSARGQVWNFGVYLACSVDVARIVLPLNRLFHSDSERPFCRQGRFPCIASSYILMYAAQIYIEVIFLP